jgi:hypothetical protein
MMLNKIGMKKNSNPARMFEQIASVENRYNTMTSKIPQDELIAIVLDKATLEYQAVLTAEQRAQGNALTLDDLESVMNQHWRQISGGKDIDDDDNEVGLTGIDGKAMICFKCNEEGHKASNCPENRKGKCCEEGMYKH